MSTYYRVDVPLFCASEELPTLLQALERAPELLRRAHLTRVKRGGREQLKTKAFIFECQRAAEPNPYNFHYTHLRAEVSSRSADEAPSVKRIGQGRER